MTRTAAAVVIADRVADAAGVVTTAIGGALTLAPARTSAVLGLSERQRRPRDRFADLVVGPGLLAGRPRWPWMAARAALNMVIAGQYRDCVGASPANGASPAEPARSLGEGVAAVVFRACSQFGRRRFGGHFATWSAPTRRSPCPVPSSARLCRACGRCPVGIGRALASERVEPSAPVREQDHRDQRHDRERGHGRRSGTFCS